MKSNTLVLPSGPFAGVEAAFKRIVAGIHWLKIAHAEARRRARARAELETLDEHALRDLGLERSELDSYLAESLHHAESTRRRTGG
jgi:uncharacterized protein YjiS (DUF1127 family)